jgi:hypothetical protein
MRIGYRLRTVTAPRQQQKPGIDTAVFSVVAALGRRDPPRSATAWLSARITACFQELETFWIDGAFKNNTRLKTFNLQMLHVCTLLACARTGPENTVRS